MKDLFTQGLWFDELTTNGQLELATNSLLEMLTTNGISGRLTTNGLLDMLTTNGLMDYPG